MVMGGMGGEEWILHGWKASIAKRIEAEIPSVRGYPLKAESGAGLRVFVYLKGAEGDVSAGRELRGKLDKILREEIERQEQVDGYQKGEEFGHRISSFNKGGDTLLDCELVLL